MSREGTPPTPAGPPPRSGEELGADDPAGEFASIGNEERGDHKAILKNLPGTGRGTAAKRWWRGVVITGRHYRSDSIFQLCQHKLCRQTQHPEPARRQPRIAPRIPFGPVTRIMRLPVNLYRQPSFETGEVEHDFAERVLPPEFVPAGAFAQLAPHQHFGQIAGAPLAFRYLKSGIACGEHPSTTLRAVPLPVPGRFLGGVIRNHIRNTPNPRSSTGASTTAANASPSTSRVCAGSIIPSSHSRAVAW